MVTVYLPPNCWTLSYDCNKNVTLLSGCHNLPYYFKGYLIIILVNCLHFPSQSRFLETKEPDVAFVSMIFPIPSNGIVRSNWIFCVPLNTSHCSPVRHQAHPLVPSITRKKYTSIHAIYLRTVITIKMWWNKLFQYH